jgi:hypothetical protein
MVAFWPLMCCSPKVFWQTWSWFFGNGILQALEIFSSKRLLADVELVLGHGSLLAFYLLLSKGLLADVEPVIIAW